MGQPNKICAEAEAACTLETLPSFLLTPLTFLGFQQRSDRLRGSVLWGSVVRVERESGDIQCSALSRQSVNWQTDSKVCVR